MSLFVGGLSQHVPERELEGMFRKFGYCRVDVKRGFAFVDYDDERDAEDALREMHGRMLSGLRLNVEWSRRH
eukprot:CAMPEP_0184679680 /NCGR_PEP_ID=MMETSP0312-20130426/2520_1 /TAXON_ID=31354 /ORGANISM="Compsopogon coeruleus, Strain SAG 36.94" /LENGTH=71 /DNA_ID=CAMNT_0027129275 /DNA_START=181 /DNA_END=393 /DNA_ORIENTATION=-